MFRNLYVEILTPNARVLGGGALGRGIGMRLEHRELVDRNLLPSHHVRTQQEGAVHELESGPFTGQVCWGHVPVSQPPEL